MIVEDGFNLPIILLNERIEGVDDFGMHLTQAHAARHDGRIRGQRLGFPGHLLHFLNQFGLRTLWP